MARNKTKKLELGKMEPLTQNPFAALGSQFGIKAQADSPTQKEAKETAQKPTGKAKLLIRLEKRKKGKQVTCIYHLDEQAPQMLKKLKQKLGTGGTITEKALEVQGDHQEKARAFLIEQGYQVRN